VKTPAHIVPATGVKGMSLVIGILLVAGSAAATPGSRVLWQGPLVAGDSLVWSEANTETAAVHLWTPRGERVVYSADSLALGRPIAASRTLLAFERSYPGCAPQPDRVCPQRQDALVGPLTGPFRPLAHPRNCVLATEETALALDDGVAAYLDVDCARNRVRVLVRDVAHSRQARVVRDAPVSSACCRDVAIAGRYVAWNDDRHTVAVYDRVARRIAYRASVGPPEGIDVELGFDLQRDGKLAIAYRLVEVARTIPTTIAWYSRASPRAHVLPLRGRDTRIRIAGDHIALERSPIADTSALVVTDLVGRPRTFAGFALPARLRSFDFDGARIAWASDRVTSTRIDCPPPGQGRPCVRRESGVTTLWRRAVDGRARVIARLPFVDAIARGA
jgi:hypothetical protein